MGASWLASPDPESQPSQQSAAATNAAAAAGRRRRRCLAPGAALAAASARRACVPGPMSLRWLCRAAAASARRAGRGGSIGQAASAHERCIARARLLVPHSSPGLRRGRAVAALCPSTALVDGSSYSRPQQPDIKEFPVHQQQRLSPAGTSSRPIHGEAAQPPPPQH